MSKIQLILENNPNFLDRIKYVIEFYSNEKNYENSYIIKDGGILARDLLTTIDKIYEELKKHENFIHKEYMDDESLKRVEELLKYFNEK